MAANELKAARKSLNAGRIDEALLHLWNGLEAVRLGGGSERRVFEQLAADVRARGDEGERKEAERLLAELEPVGDGGPSVWTVADGAPGAPVERSAGEDVAAEVASEDSPITSEEQMQGRRSPGLGRLLFPLLILLFVLVNLIRQLAGGD